MFKNKSTCLLPQHNYSCKIHGLETPEDREPIYVFKLDGSRSVDAAVELYRNLPEVEYAESNFIYSSAGI